MCYLCTRIYTNKVKYMKKIVISLATALAATSAFAGGLLTTTSQNAHYLRFFTQDANITLSSLYANPAGQAFLHNGWHMGISSMTAIQSRTIDTTFPAFALNTNNPNPTHTFKGEALAPVVPSVDVTYNQDKWSISAHLGLVGGGGACEFENGLGSLEALTVQSGIQGIANMWANSPYGNTGMTVGQATVMGYMQQGMSKEQAMAQMQKDAAAFGAQNFKSYSVNSYMKGKQYYFGLQVGATYKVLDNLAVYGGIRGVYATCNYNGFVEDVTVNGTATGTELSLICDQVGFGVTPILGIHYRPNKHWDLAAKYEFKTRIRLENNSRMSEAAAAFAADPTHLLSQFADGKKIAEDMPALLTVGAQYSPIKDLRIAGAWHYYFDKSATKYGDKHTSAYIDHNTMEFLAGVEWQFCKWITASCSWQNTSYGLTDAYMSDVSFNLSSNSMGLGIRIHPTKLFNIDLGYMHTFYKDREVTSVTALGNKIDRYSRTNDVVGIGFNFAW